MAADAPFFLSEASAYLTAELPDSASKESLEKIPFSFELNEMLDKGGLNDLVRVFGLRHGFSDRFCDHGLVIDNLLKLIIK